MEHVSQAELRSNGSKKVLELKTEQAYRRLRTHIMLIKHIEHGSSLAKHCVSQTLDTNVQVNLPRQHARPADLCRASLRPKPLNQVKNSLNRATP